MLQPWSSGVQVLSGGYPPRALSEIAARPAAPQGDCHVPGRKEASLKAGPATTGVTLIPRRVQELEVGSNLFPSVGSDQGWQWRGAAVKSRGATGMVLWLGAPNPQFYKRLYAGVGVLVCAHLGALRALKLQKGGEAKGKQESQEGLAAPPPLCFLLGGLGGAACGFRLAKEARGHGGCGEMGEEHQGWH